MKALVVYDSVFGNTEKVAQAVGRALGTPNDVTVVRVSDVKPAHLAGVTLLVVGSPTRAFRPLPSVSKWLKSLPAGALKGVQVAAFDTRISPADANSAFLTFMVGIFGYAAKPMGDTLAKKGGKSAVAPEGFFVKGTEGPLKDGEQERAATWARQIASAR
jgi:flavodoxin I